MKIELLLGALLLLIAGCQSKGSKKPTPGARLPVETPSTNENEPSPDPDQPPPKGRAKDQTPNQIGQGNAYVCAERLRVRSADLTEILEIKPAYGETVYLSGEFQSGVIQGKSYDFIEVSFIYRSGQPQGWVAASYLSRIPCDEIFESNQAGRKLSGISYYAQRDNEFHPSGTCGMTSAAMLLSFWDRNSQRKTIPDDIYAKYGGHQKGKSPEGLAEIYRDYGFSGKYSRTFTRTKMKELIDAGRPFVLHGYFTDGHILLVTGYNEKGFIVNDPAGEWKRCFKCGYGDPGRGEDLVYSYAEMSERVIGRDGDIWVSYIEL